MRDGVSPTAVQLQQQFVGTHLYEGVGLQPEARPTLSKIPASSEAWTSHVLAPSTCGEHAP